MKMRNFLSVHRQWMHFFCSFIFIFLSACFSALEASDNYTLDLEEQNRSNEVMALLVFKQKSVDADPEGFLNDWRSESLSPCSWQGVSCSPHGKVSIINFTDAGLIGHLHMDDLIVLESLQHLHLNGNSFSGSLGQISFLTELDISNNNLTGPIPSSGQLTTFPASSYENNRGLCGIPLPPCGYHPDTDPIRSEQSQNGKNHSILRNVDWIWVIAVIGYIFGVAIGVCVGNIMFQDKEEWLIKTKLMIISKCKRTKKSCRIIDRNIHDRRENWNIN